MSGTLVLLSDYVKDKRDAIYSEMNLAFSSVNNISDDTINNEEVIEDKKEEIIKTLASEAKSNDTALSINALVELRKEYGMNIEDDEMSKLYSTYISNSLLSAKSKSSK